MLLQPRTVLRSYHNQWHVTTSQFEACLQNKLSCSCSAFASCCRVRHQLKHITLVVLDQVPDSHRCRFQDSITLEIIVDMHQSDDLQKARHATTPDVP